MGDNFEQLDMENAEFGLNTGVYFYKTYLQEKETIPVIFFSHKSDAKIPKNIGDNQIYLLKKIAYLPSEFVKKLIRF